MRYVRLGRTDLSVSVLGLGGGALGMHDHGDVSIRDATASVDAALDAGINLFDTADVYGLGAAEVRLGQALGRRRHEVVIVSKFGIKWLSGSNDKRATTFRDSSPSHVRNALHSSLRRLQVERIPVYLIHWPDPNTPLVDTIEALLRCREEGKIGYLGVSNFSAPDVLKILNMCPDAVVQVPYSLVQREVEADLLPLCGLYGTGVMVYGAMAQGLLSGRYKSDMDFGESDRRSRLRHFRDEFLDSCRPLLGEMARVATSHGKSMVQIALRWVLSQASVTAVLVGAKNPQQVSESVSALEGDLIEEDLSILSNLSFPFKNSDKPANL